MTFHFSFSLLYLLYTTLYAIVEEKEKRKAIGDGPGAGTALRYVEGVVTMGASGCVPLRKCIDDGG